MPTRGSGSWRQARVVDASPAQDAVRVVIDSTDQVTRVGLACLLRRAGGVEVLGPGDPVPAQVLLYATHRFDAGPAARLRRLSADLGLPVVLVVDDLEEGDLLTAVQYGVVAVVLRSTMAVDLLADHLTCAAAGGAALPPDMLSEFLVHVRKLRHELNAQRGMNALGLTERELDVLRLLADGHDTGEIAEKLAYSERTIKNILSAVIRRLGFRNRTHAVASAIQAGLV